MTGYLLRKLRRDLVRNWTQFTAVFLMAFLSVLCYTGLEGAWYGIDRSLNSFADETSLADGWVTSTSIDPQQAAALADVPGVESLATVAQVPVQQVDDGEVTGRLALESTSDAGISTPVVVEGTAPNSDAGSVWLNRDYADAHDLTLGDTVTVTAGGAPTTLTIRGTILSSDQIYFTGTPSLVAPAPDLYGYGVTGRENLNEIAGVEVPDTLARAAGDTTELRDRAPEILGDGFLRFTTQETNSNVSIAFDRVTQIRTLSVLFSFIFILLSLLAMYTSVRRLAEMQRRDVATLKALGYSRRTIGFHFASYGLITGGIGGLLGLAIAPVQSLFVLSTQKSMLALPKWSIAYTPTVAAVALLVAAICTFGAYIASRGALRGLPAEGMRDKTLAGRRSIVERIPALWRTMTYGSRWAARDAGRNVVRIAMGIIAVAGCMMLLFAGFGMPDSMNAQVKSAFVEENVYTAKVFVAGPEAADAVVAAAPRSQLVTETMAVTRPDDGFDRVVTVIDDGDFLRLFDAEGTIIDPADGPVLTEGASDILGIGVGDSIEVRTAGSTSWESLKIANISAASQPQGVFVTAADWEAGGETFVPNVVLVGPNADLDEISEIPGVVSVLTREAQEENATGLVGDLFAIFMLIRVFAVLLAIIVLYSLGALSFTERTRDYATLSVLGFRPRDIRSLVMRENIAVTAVGLVIGVPAGLWFMGVYVNTFSTETIVYTPQITAVSVAIAVALTTVFSLLTTFLLARRIARIDMTGALKSVE